MKNKKKYLFSFLFLVFGLGGLLAYNGTFSSLLSAAITAEQQHGTATPRACPADAKICSDNSKVFRTGPSCGFAPCPKARISPTPHCRYNGKSYQNGEGFKDECNTCGCTNGEIVCTMKACPIVSPSPSASPSSSPRVTPVCVPRPACLDSKPACMLAVPKEGWCPTPLPTVSPTATASSSPTPHCRYNGKSYQNGEGFKDECNTCGCTNGEIVCTMKACPIASPSASASPSSSPRVTPVCVPRPACLDSKPACAIPETPDMCPPLPKIPGQSDKKECSLYNATIPVTNNVGAAYNVFSTEKETVLKSKCGDQSFSVHAQGSSSRPQDFMVYRFGYWWNGKNWKKFQFFPLDQKSTTEEQGFIPGAAISKNDLPYAAGDTTYWIGFVCLRHENTWKCGCNNNRCAKSVWNMQAANKKSDTNTDAKTLSATAMPTQVEYLSKSLTEVPANTVVGESKITLTVANASSTKTFESELAPYQSIEYYDRCAAVWKPFLYPRVPEGPPSASEKRWTPNQTQTYEKIIRNDGSEAAEKFFKNLQYPVKMRFTFDASEQASTLKQKINSSIFTLHRPRCLADPSTQTPPLPADYCSPIPLPCSQTE